MSSVADGRYRQAPSYIVLARRAQDVPYASVDSGHPRTATVNAYAR
jgi:hypothetical protein